MVFEVREKVEHPHGVRVARGEREWIGFAGKTQAGVLVRDEFCAPAVFAFRAVVRRRIGKEVIGVGVGIAGADVAVNPVNEKVEAAEAECELL